MNAQPHTHELKFHIDRDGDAHIRYGDQSALVWTWNGLLFNARCRRRVRKMIRQHNRASVRAGRIVEDNGLAVQVNEIAQREAARWVGS